MKIIRNIALACTALILASCNNFLDIVPPGKVIPKNYSEYKAVIVNAYDLFPEDRGLVSLRSDEGKFVETRDNIDFYGDIYTWKDKGKLASTSEFNWKNYYHVIFLANHIILEQNSISEGTPDEISQLVGEAYLLRAYSHFLLVNLFAKPYDEATAASTPGIPIRTSVSMDDVPVRNSVKEVYDQILSDISEAESRLKIKRWDKKDSFRFSISAAQAFKARVLLYMNRWSDAAAVSMQIIKSNDYHLVDITQSVFVLPCEAGSPENILALEQIYTSSTKGVIDVSDELFDLYNQDCDLRYTVYIDFVNFGHVDVKKNGGKDRRCSFRLSEQYLIAAEAYAHSDLSEAIKPLMDLKKARYRKTNMSNVDWEKEKEKFFAEEEARLRSLDQAGFLDEVAKERQRELCFEGHRWFDLRRTTRPRIVHKFQNVVYTLQADDPRYTVLFPQEALDNNANLSTTY